MLKAVALVCLSTAAVAAGHPQGTAFVAAGRGVAAPRAASLRASAPRATQDIKTGNEGVLCQAAFGLAAVCVAAAARSAVARRGHASDKQLGYRINGAPGRPGAPHGWTEPIRWCARFKRRIHIRRKLEGTPARPRLAVFRSLEHMHVNVVDDTIGNGVSLVTVSTLMRDVKGKMGESKSRSEQAAEEAGKMVAAKCLEKGITQVCFDRGGFKYEGRVKALAEAARAAGLQF